MLKRTLDLMERSVKRDKIAIMGANSHIAKNLIYNFLQSGRYSLYLFSRTNYSTGKFIKSLKDTPMTTNIQLFSGYENFFDHEYDAVINCVGVGTANKLEKQFYKWFTVTEEFDNLALKYLEQKNPQALYISFSSGAVYGRDFSEPATGETINHLPINDLKPTDYYTIARLNAETKHRALNYLNIVDLRIFSFFSRFIDLTDNYFMTELLNCVINKNIFHTNKQNIFRDFIHPDDLFLLLKKCLGLPIINQAFDVNSRKPIDKWSIIDYFQNHFDIKVGIDKEHNRNSATGAKEHYYSNYKNTEEIGFTPKFTSMETIQQEAKNIIKQQKQCPST